MADRPTPEIDIDEPLVRALLAEQHPDMVDLPLIEIGRGWDNTMFKLGEHAAVRLPHRAVAAPLLTTEQRWLTELAPTLPIPVPAPIRIGRPSGLFPWAWSVVPWYPGRPLSAAPSAHSVDQARRIGQFLQALHRPAPPDAPQSPWRGEPLKTQSEAFTTRLADLAGTIYSDSVDALRASFERAVAIPAPTDPDRESEVRSLIHGDLHTRNVVATDKEITAVVDWGDVCAGDPATDLAIAWMFENADATAVLLSAVNASAETVQRAQGWAAHFACIYLTNSDDDPTQAAIGALIVDALRSHAHR